MIKRCLPSALLSDFSMDSSTGADFEASRADLAGDDRIDRAPSAFGAGARLQAEWQSGLACGSERSDRSVSHEIGDHLRQRLPAHAPAAGVS